VDRLDTIESVLRLTQAERSSHGGALSDIRVVRERLESALGGTVRPAEAARLLGVSRPSLKRWLDSGDIPTVLTRQGRREIPISELVDLMLETEELRRLGHKRVLSAVIRRRRQAARALDVDALLPPRRPRTHRQAELQSLAYHRLVAGRLTPDTVAEALRNVDRWEDAGQLDPRWASEWRHILERPLPEIRRAIGSDSKRARELRQTSPFVGSVTEHERRQIIEAVEARR
jgi:excisionase family DNA binding protein